MDKPRAPRQTKNALADSASPYLRQHADNPVDWHPWGPEAFAEARRRDVPVVISIGYSTCHWCHVMAHETFEDDATAALMNGAFVCVKVDREEHPEVDEIYMDAVQALTGHGGWPLHAVVDHDGRPFFAGTYFPREQWQSVLTQLSRLWREERERVLGSAAEITAHLERLTAPTAPGALPPDRWARLQVAVERAYDRADPGFSRAPKFPPSQLIELLLLRRDPEAARGRELAEAVLEAMQDSGLHDRVGGGFHRYSTDGAWRVPHFEKMLYDNALLIGDYAMAGALLARPDFLRTAENAGDYLLRDLRVSGADGRFVGYASAEDADDPGGEGSFYAWSPEAVAAVLGDGVDAAALVAAWDLAPGERELGRSGHWEPVTSFIPHPRGAAPGGALGRGEEAQRLRASWEPQLPLLRAARDQRPRPERDDKVLTDLNGLALRAFALLGRHHGGARFVAATRELAACLEGRFTAGGLERMAGRPAFVTDYGHLALGATEAYLLLGEPALIDLARRAVDEAIARLRAPDGGFFTTPAGRDDLIRRSREQADGPYPAGQHALAFAAARLGAITGEPRYRALTGEVVRVQASLVERAPTAVPTLLRAVLEAEAEAVVVVSPGEGQEALLARARAAVRAGLAVVPTAGHEGQRWPILEGRRELAGAQALVCVGTRCLLPARAPDELDARLAEV